MGQDDISVGDTKLKVGHCPVAGGFPLYYRAHTGALLLQQDAVLGLEDSAIDQQLRQPPAGGFSLTPG